MAAYPEQRPPADGPVLSAHRLGATAGQLFAAHSRGLRTQRCATVNIPHVRIDGPLERTLTRTNKTLSLCLLEMSCAGSSGQVDGEPQRALQPGDPGGVVRAHAGVSPSCTPHHTETEVAAQP